MKNPNRHQREKKQAAQARAAGRIAKAEVKQRAMQAACARPPAPHNGHDERDPPQPSLRDFTVLRRK